MKKELIILILFGLMSIAACTAEWKTRHGPITITILPAEVFELYRLVSTRDINNVEFVTKSGVRIVVKNDE